MKSSANPPEGTLTERHLCELRASGLDDEVIAERGYRTVTDVGELLELGFAAYQARPGLLIPLHSTDGSNGYYALKPNQPRLEHRPGKPDRPVKYEYPVGTQPILDVPPRCLEQLADATVAILFTEGAKKADCAARLGYCAVNCWGTSNWYRNPAHGGFATIQPLPDWDAIPLDGRICLLTFDSDAWRQDKPSVGLALRRLANFLAGRGAIVYIVVLPDAADGSKQGLDDYVVAHGAEAFGELVAAAEPEPHGSQGMLRRLQARVRELEAERSAIFAALCSAALSPAERLVGVLAINTVNSPISRGAAAPVRVTIEATRKDDPEHPFGLAQDWGLSRNTVSKAIGVVCQDGGPLSKRTTHDRGDDGQVRSTTYLAPADAEASTADQYRALARVAPVRDPSRAHQARPPGGQRCPDCPTGTVLRTVCTGCGSVIAERSNPPSPPTHKICASEAPGARRSHRSSFNRTNAVRRAETAARGPRAPTRSDRAAVSDAFAQGWEPEELVL